MADAVLGPDAILQTIEDTQVRPSQVHGLGLFSLRSRVPGEIVCRLDGQEIDPELFPGVLEALEWNALTKRRLLVRALRTSYGFINHSRHANLAIDIGGREIRTTVAIAAGDELTLDYLAQPIPDLYLAGPHCAYLRG